MYLDMSLYQIASSVQTSSPLLLVWLARPSCLSAQRSTRTLMWDGLASQTLLLCVGHHL